MRVKDFTKKVGSGVTPKGGAEVYQDYGVPLFRSQNVTNDGFLLDDIAYISEDIDESMSSTRVKPNDVLLNITGASIGRCYYTPNDFERGNVNQHVCIIRPTKKIIAPYLYYNFISDIGQRQIELTQTGSNREGLTKENICNFEFEVPPVDAQRSIVSYLDSHISSIDKRMSLLATKLDLYLRLKTAIINRAVTQGLNPDVKMKESGVEWIGMIPEHWDVRLFKNVMTIHNGRDYKHIEAEEDDEIVFPVIGSGGPFANAKQALYSGEVLFLGRKGTIDKPLYWNGPFWTVDTMFYAIPSKKTFCRYMYYLSLSFPYWKIGTQTALPSMTQTALNCIKLCCPPFSEQQVISTYLDEKCAKIDAIIENLNQQIDKHKLLKRALINEVITGQRAV